MNESGSSREAGGPAYGGLAVYGAAITGLFGWVLAFAAVFSGAGILAGAVALVASALGFGLLANALFRV